MHSSPPHPGVRVSVASLARCSGGSGSRLLSVAALEAEGVPALLEAHASGQLQRRHRFLSAAADDLRVVRPCALIPEEPSTSCYHTNC